MENKFKVHSDRVAFAVLNGGGHNLQIEQQKLFNSLVNELLVRVDEL